jgi:hypothetical protein
VATEEDILARVEEALARDGAWRAKEILRGNIGSRGYCPALYRRYGELLLGLGEQLEAGKYLFLSNERSPEYEDAIAVFLARRGDCGPAGLLASFPKGARLLSVSEYPEPLRSELVHLGATGRPRGQAPPAREPTGPVGKAFEVGCALVALFVLVLVGIGLVTVVRRLF